MSIDPKFVELAADVVEIILLNGKKKRKRVTLRRCVVSVRRMIMDRNCPGKSVLFALAKSKRVVYLRRVIHMYNARPRITQLA